MINIIICKGTTPITVNGNTSKPILVDFGYTFSELPIVTAITNSNWANSSINISDRSQSQVTFLMANGAGTKHEFNIYWMAIGYF